MFGTARRFNFKKLEIKENQEGWVIRLFNRFIMQ